jgi:hypothetical protein
MTLSWHGLYELAMHITEEDSARIALAAFVKFHMHQTGCTREEAEAIQRSNLGYFAGYYNNETRERVERLFQCEHPIFGSIAKNGPPTAEQAFEMGQRLGESMRRPAGER